MKKSILSGLALVLTMQSAVLADQAPATVLPIASPSPLTNTPAVLPIPSMVTITLPGGTLVPVHLVSKLSSASAKEDDTFQIAASQDVVINDMIVIRQGAGGEGHIVDSAGAGGSGRSGSISLAFDYIYSVDGGRVRLQQSSQTQTEEDRKGASSTATFIGVLTFGIGGFFGHNLARGHQKIIDTKTILSSFVSRNVRVDTNEKGNEIRYNK